MFLSVLQILSEPLYFFLNKDLCLKLEYLKKKIQQKIVSMNLKKSKGYK